MTCFIHSSDLKLNVKGLENGKEFAFHHKIAKDLKVKTYFTRPYTSQDKGTVENRIGVIRRFFPKKTDLREVSNKRIKEVEKMHEKLCLI